MTRRTSIVPNNRTRDFKPHELFFSVTNERGIIQHGNSVFTRVSGFSEEELFGAPHSLIRHPDMPRAVFQLLWETIQSGKTIAAYVKNLASDGCYYWVLAVVMPCRKGYLSIRLKPTTALLNQIEEIYARLTLLEKTIERNGESRDYAMQTSRSELEKILRSLDFADYDAFMMQALTSELSAHNSIVSEIHEPSSTSVPNLCPRTESHKKDYEEWDELLLKAFESLETFQTTSASLAHKSDSIRTNAESIRIISMNASIAASKVGDKAATLRVVAEALGYASVDTHRIGSSLAERMLQLSQALKRLVFDVAATKLQSEIGKEFSREVGCLTSDAVDQRLHLSAEILREELDLRTKKILEHIFWAQAELGQQISLISRLQANTRALRFVRFAGTKEAVDAETHNVFATLFSDVQEQIAQIQLDCDYLSLSMKQTAENIRKLEQTFSSVTRLDEAA